MLKRVACLFALAMFLTAGTAFGQSRPIEFGIDGGITYSMLQDMDGMEFDDELSFDIPFSTLRVGFFVSDNISVEPQVQFSFFDPGGDSDTQMQLGLLAAVLYHFQPDMMETQFFVRGGGAFFMYDFGGDVDDTLFGFGGGAGVKVPIADSFMFRAGGDVVYMLEGDITPAMINIIGSVGVSFFLQ
ncbi:MAG: outer membrane beta-barrel protein [Gemmatimonadales bacterium]|jgi:hypothetical protein